jgi:glycine cleavage system H protein
MAELHIPADFRYTRDDEWVKLDGDEAVIGVTDYAQNALSDLVYVELPQVGDTFKAGERIGTVESVKAASDISMPIGGTVVAVNAALEGTPEKVNQEPYGAGWFIRIKPANATEMETLLDAVAYKAYCAERE